LVGTVGQIAIPNSAINVIPGRCELSLDIRGDQEDTLVAAIADVFRRMRQIERSRGVTIIATEMQRTPVVACAGRLQSVLAGGLRASGVTVHYLPSGAGHDAVMFDGLTDVGMLFVRCGNGGVSHSPRESVTAADADIAARVLMNALMNLPQAH
jgi:acetylornithine deacetylase/succinyl-diaminopimelate desuccinylase-like protein